MIEDKQASFDHRSWAVLSLSAFEQAPEDRLLESCLHSRQYNLKIATIQLIGYFKLQSFRPRLEVEIMNLDPAISIEAMYSLMQMRCTESLVKIEHMTRNGHGMVKEAAKYVCVGNFGILERSHVTISPMIFRVILYFWLITLCINCPFASAYIFIEDISSIGSLKGLLKEKLTDNNIEVLGYTPKSLNLVLNKTNQLQTSMVWILRESFESEALIMSRCGQLEQNKYIDGLISNLENKKSKVPRLHIGWIPYKKLGQITSQCVLMEVPQTYDLASLSTELAELFKSQNEPLSEDLDEKSVVTNDVLKSANRNEIQNSKKIPMQWGQFRTADSQLMSNSTSQSVQRISYDPDEDLFLTPS